MFLYKRLDRSSVPFRMVIRGLFLLFDTDKVIMLKDVKPILAPLQKNPMPTLTLFRFCAFRLFKR